MKFVPLLDGAIAKKRVKITDTDNEEEEEGIGGEAANLQEGGQEQAKNELSDDEGPLRNNHEA